MTEAFPLQYGPQRARAVSGDGSTRAMKELGWYLVALVLPLHIHLLRLLLDDYRENTSRDHHGAKNTVFE
jgi:hypothetical protein